MDARISDIQKFSLHDGPGIRTTVFFKGCNMRCVWCHNPETYSARPDLMFWQSKCIGCGACYLACRTGALEKKDGRRYDPEKCIRCGACAEVCAPQALKMVGRTMSVEAVMETILRDRDYYASSGGGVTLSGGEVLLQAEFAAQLLKACKEHGLSTAIETNLSLPFAKLELLLPYLDRIYCDLKIMDDAKHIRFTGLSNRIVLENLEKLKQTDIPITVRTPIIPGFTDDEENIAAIAGWLHDHARVEQYELLNYNPLAEAKCEELGIPYTPGRLQRKTRADMAKLASAAGKAGIRVRVGGD